MNQPYLRQYLFTIKTLSPVFIGSGKKVGKKEYLFNRRKNSVTFLNMWKFFQGLDARGLLPAYQDYMLKENWSDLYQFLKDQGIGAQEYEEWADYTINVADADLTNKRNKEIMTFTKDPYGQPYVPGSSLKGAFRTIFQNAWLLEHPEEAEAIASEIRNARPEKNKKRYMKDVDKHMGEKAFHRMLFEESEISDIRNDSMRGVVVSDSDPLPKENLGIFQKVDLSLAGEERPLPLLRECLLPGTTIQFTVTVDSQICDYKGKDFINAINAFYKHYQSQFLSKFRAAPKLAGNASTFFLGGGAGYVSKTNTYAVLPGMDGVRAVGEILNTTLPDKVKPQHDHLHDKDRGASPHLLKCTVDAMGSLVQMGACHVLSISKINKEEMNQ